MFVESNQGRIDIRTARVAAGRKPPRRKIMALAIAAGMLMGSACLWSPPVAAQAAAATATAAQYAIPAGSLGSALDTLAREGNVQVVYAPALVQGKTTRGLQGSFTATAALSRLLRGTGLAWKSVNATTFVLRADPPPPGSRAAAPAPASTATKKPPKTLETVQVSGSLINNAQIQTATPTFTITAQQIKDQGFTSVEDTLQNSVFSVGSVQGEATSGSFTQGAKTFSFFGLPPGYSLILVDGKPLASFGELYNGTSTFNNVSNIPSSIIERIDVMPGGSSSIYGSSAMAGVVNIVTKSHMNGAEVSARIGSYSLGGRGNQQVTFAFGHDFGKLSVLGSFEFENKYPLWGYQRELTSGTDQAPEGPFVPTLVAGIYDYGHGHKKGHQKGYISPADGCSATAGLYDDSTFETPNPDHPSYAGTYCGSYAVKGYATLSSQSKHYDGLLKLTYDVNDKLRLYADVSANYENKRYVSSVPHWNTDHWPGAISDVVEDATSHEIIRFYKRFGPEEMPGGMFGPARAYTQNNLLSFVDLGANGQFGESDWSWNAYYYHAGDRTRYNKPLWLSTVVNGFFQDKVLGPEVGVDPTTHLPMYNPDYDAFFTPLTPAESASLIYNNYGVAKSWINNTRVLVSNPSLFHLAGGDAGVAALVEGGNEAWYEPIDPNMANGLVWGHAATAGGGRRNHQAVAFELNLPLLKQLTVDLSGREDRYTTGVGPDNDKFTWKAGIEWRPFDSLLVRGNYATSFKAPDMAGMFLGPSTSFGSETDYYQCAVAQAPNCDDYDFDIEKTHLGNPGLRPTTAKSWTTGLVWAPTRHLSFSAGYMHIAIDNETVLQDIDTLMREEAQCRLGQMDINSPNCQALVNPATGQVQRDQFGNVSAITAYYANLANEQVNSVNAGMQYSFDTQRLGSFHFRLAYNDMLKHTSQEYPGSPVNDELRNPLYNVGFKSVVNGSISWHPNRQWRTTLYWHRYGSMPNFAAMDDGSDDPDAGRVSPWTTFNWSVDYMPGPGIELSLRANNLFNRLPPRDMTNTSYPYYNTDLYNINGRAIMFETDIKFGDMVHH